jgi:hypothetical protein
MYRKINKFIRNKNFKGQLNHFELYKESREIYEKKQKRTYSHLPKDTFTV